MRRLLPLVIFCLSWLPIWAQPAHALSAGGLVAAANAQRAAAGLAPLALNGALSVAASNKAADMIRNNYWSHVSPSGVGPWYWISAAGYPYLYAGENLSQGYFDDYSVMIAWMNSPEHRANVLGANYRDMGCGFASGTLLGHQTTVVACDFASTAAPARQAAAPAPAPVRHYSAPVSQPAASAAPAMPQAVTPPAAATPMPVPKVAVPDYFKHSLLWQTSTQPSLESLIKQILP
jgi:hypothetical protein